MIGARKRTERHQTAIGIIGCGGVTGSLHLPALVSIPDVTVKWLCDSSSDRARTLGRTWGIDQAFQGVRECSAVDAVLVATPVGTRQEIMDEVMRRGWHALCEKPFALTKADHVRILECAVQRNLILGAGYMRRQFWSVRKAREILRSRTLGRLRAIVASEPAQLARTGLDLSSYRNNLRQAGGGVLVETGSHLLDEVVFLSDAIAAGVETCEQKVWNGYEVETRASGFVTLEAGMSVPIHITVSGITPLFAGIAFRCELGEIRVRLDPTKNLELLVGQSRKRVELPPPKLHQQHVAAAFREEWVHFLQAVESRSEWAAERETGLMITDFIERCGEMANMSRTAVTV